MNDDVDWDAGINALDGLILSLDNLLFYLEGLSPEEAQRVQPQVSAMNASLAAHLKQWNDTVASANKTTKTNNIKE